MSDGVRSIGLASPGGGDRAFVRRLSRQVFSRFGDYASFLPETMRDPEVRTLVARVAGRPVGFAMISLEDVGVGEIDLVAIAVAPEHQGQGIGRELLAAVEEQARRILPRARASVRLTVAEDNPGAWRLFEAFGFARVPGPGGTYPNGQPCVTLRKRLDYNAPS